MEWNIVIHEKIGYVEVITRGIADTDGSMNMARAIAYTMRTHRMTKVLIDHGNIEGVAGTTIDIYDRPTMFILIGILLSIKIAEIINPEQWEHFQFFETVCRNRGYQLSVFEDKDKALKWLLA